jgi:REP element-mobilizing transposase RayT
MIHGFHVIFSTYGFWLPNDPRGSWSDWVRRWELVRFGKATKVGTRVSVAGVSHDFELRRKAKQALKYPEVHLTGRQAQAVGIGFRTAVDESGYTIYACSILPQHVHVVLGPHKRRVQLIVGHLKARATQQLNDARLHPLSEFKESNGTIPSPWGRNCWKVFVFDEVHMRKAIKYVQKNPAKERKPRQRWSCVQPSPHAHAEQAPPLNRRS